VGVEWGRDVRHGPLASPYQIHFLPPMALGPLGRSGWKDCVAALEPRRRYAATTGATAEECGCVCKCSDQTSLMANLGRKSMPQHRAGIDREAWLASYAAGGRMSVD
jgi:hypothetical protein